MCKDSNVSLFFTTDTYPFSRVLITSRPIFKNSGCVDLHNLFQNSRIEEKVIISFHPIGSISK